MPKLARFFVYIATICLTALLTATVQAADIAVNSSCSLADAINTANADATSGGCAAGSGADTITLTGDVTLTASLPEIESEITIEGNGYTISGNEQHQIFWVEETGALTIQNITLADGRGADDDDLFDKDFTVGGAIVNLGNITVSESAFNDNLAVDFGGAVYSYQGAKTIIKASSFTNNSTTLDSGGAIYNLGKAGISDSNFSNNSGRRHGGAIYNGGEVSISNSIFTDNSTEWAGGAISSAGEGTINVVGSRFFSNSASIDGDGGAIFNRGKASLSENRFQNNSAEEGGAIDNGGTLTVKHCVFNGNSATENGGAIYTFADAIISNSSFTENRAYDDGGALYNKGDSSISDSFFSDNSAGDEGGAIRITEYAEVSVTLSVFGENTAEDGGAVYSWGELNVSRSTFMGNSAIEEGGGIANHNTASIKDSILADNPGGDCHLGRNGELFESGNNHISDGSCAATWSGPISDDYCPQGQEQDGVCRIGAPTSTGASE